MGWRKELMLVKRTKYIAIFENVKNYMEQEGIAEVSTINNYLRGTLHITNKNQLQYIVRRLIKDQYIFKNGDTLIWNPHKLKC
jgi:hypothetical protein